jgi:hypothetical protein
MTIKAMPAQGPVDVNVRRLTALDEACYANEAAEKELEQLRAKAARWDAIEALESVRSYFLQAGISSAEAMESLKALSAGLRIKNDEASSADEVTAPVHAPRTR